MVCYLSRFAQPLLPRSFASSFSQFPSDKTQSDANSPRQATAMVGPTLKRQLGAKDLQLLNDESSTVYLFLICHLITKKKTPRLQLRFSRSALSTSYNVFAM